MRAFAIRWGLCLLALAPMVSAQGAEKAAADAALERAKTAVKAGSVITVDPLG